MFINTKGAENAFVNMESEYQIGDERYHCFSIAYSDKT